ncbi:hypothetical protein ACWEOG_37700 [Amycolatopsis japonica]
MRQTVLDDDQADALVFIATANRGGYRPSRPEVQEWLSNPRPKREPRIPPAARQKFRELLFQAGVSTTPTGHTREVVKAVLGWNPWPSLKPELVDELLGDAFPADIEVEGFIEHIVRLGWIESEGDTLGLTPLGRALLRSQYTDDRDDAVEAVVLGSNDELAYPKLIGRLVQAGNCLIIDPYLRLDQLAPILKATHVSRFLISENVREDERASMATLIDSGVAGHSVELRFASRGVLHDRMIIASNFVDTIGTSMNTVGRVHPTVLVPLPELAADAMRGYAEEWWNAATIVASHTPEAPTATESASDT